MALHTLSLTELSTRLRTRQVTSVQVTRLMLERIRRHADLGAYLLVLEEQALTAAQEADLRLERAASDGKALSPLAGVPIAIKDIYDMEGVATTGAMSFRRDHRAERDATVVARLRSAGAVILGKTVLTEGVFADHNPVYGTPVNPWNAERWCGASSSGSAVAVAAGLAYMGLSSETGGSIRIPSAMNGVTGLKPTWGRVSRAGVFELATTLDHVGPIARSVEDAEVVLRSLAGPDALDPTTTCQRLADVQAEDLNGVRIGVDPSVNCTGVDPQHVAAHEAMLQELARAGAEIVPVKAPEPTDMIWDWFDICASETALAHEESFAAHRDEYGAALAGLIERGRAMSGMDLQRVIHRRRDFRGAFEALFAKVDLVASPAMAFTPPRTQDMAQSNDEIITGLHRFTCPYTMSGHPALSVPAGMHTDGMPINAQLLGPLMGEAALIRAGRVFQSRTGHHRRMPMDLELA